VSIGLGDNMTSEEWNRMYPEGTLVRYFPIKGYMDEYEDLLTRSEAFEDSCGNDVIFLQHKSGYVNLEHVSPLDQPTQKKREPVHTDHPRISPPSHNDPRARCRAACKGNKWAEENCKAVGNW